MLLPVFRNIALVRADQSTNNYDCDQKYRYFHFIISEA